MTVATLNLDFDRVERLGYPEVVYGQGKTVNEILAAATRLVDAHGMVLVTRASSEALAALQAALPAGRAHPRSGCFCVGGEAANLGPVAVISAGTADEAVAEEACVTLAARRVRVERLRDCGVAGLHRLIAVLPTLRRCQAAVVVAGMEGALPSVVGGLIDIPIIACPTSVGYGVASGGTAALHAMLSSCAPGITVVNIDNGFGAGYAAASIARQIAQRQASPRGEAAGAAAST
jgi:NCAIR mutase (PurE)-related protein